MVGRCIAVAGEWPCGGYKYFYSCNGTLIKLERMPSRTNQLFRYLFIKVRNFANIMGQKLRYPYNFIQ